MSDEELQTIWQQSIDHYGTQLQSIVCMEECAELTQAISKKLREPMSPNDHLPAPPETHVRHHGQDHQRLGGSQNPTNGKTNGGRVITKAKYSFTVTAILDAANTIEAADKLRGLLEDNGFEQTSCECGGVTLGPKTIHVINECSCCGDPDCDIHHVFTLRCNAYDCYNTIDVGEDDWGYYPERKEDAIRYAVECEG